MVLNVRALRRLLQGNEREASGHREVEQGKLSGLTPNAIGQSRHAVLLAAIHVPASRGRVSSVLL